MTDWSGPRRVEAVQFERRVLNAARQELPSRALSERMARGAGVSTGVVVMTSALAADGAAAGSALAKSLVATPVGTSWVAWASGGLVVAALGAAAGIAVSTPSVSPQASEQRDAELELLAPAAKPVRLEPSLPRTVSIAPPQAQLEVKEPPGKSPRARTAPRGDLRHEIELVDQARSELRVGRGTRALRLIDEYFKRYPRGSFRPEATALRVEALMKEGRAKEARALASRFVTGRKRTPLAERVARVAGIQDR